MPFISKKSELDFFERGVKHGAYKSPSEYQMGLISEMFYDDGCGGRTRTSDLRVMSPTSCQLLHPALERVMGIEPTLLAWKARALPLSYTRKLVERTGFEPVKAEPADLQSAPFGQLGNLSILCEHYSHKLHYTQGPRQGQEILISIYKD